MKFLGSNRRPLRQKPAIRGDICSESPPKVCEIDMAQGEDMSKQLPDPINSSDYYLHKSKQQLDEITTNEITETELYRIVLKLPN